MRPNKKRTVRAVRFFVVSFEGFDCVRGLFLVQQAHGFFRVARDPVGNDGLGFADGLLNCFALSLLGRFEHIIDHGLLRRAAVARVVNADAQSPKIGCAELGLRVFQAVVTTGGAADFHFGRTCGDV